MLLLRKSKQSGTTKRGVVEIIAHPLEHALFGSNADEVTYRERMIEALGGDVWAAIKACAAGLEVPEQIEEDDALDLMTECPPDNPLIGTTPPVRRARRVTVGADELVVR